MHMNFIVLLPEKTVPGFPNYASIIARAGMGKRGGEFSQIRCQLSVFWLERTGFTRIAH